MRKSAPGELPAPAPVLKPKTQQATVRSAARPFEMGEANATFSLAVGPFECGVRDVTSGALAVFRASQGLELSRRGFRETKF